MGADLFLKAEKLMSLDNRVCHFVDIMWHATSRDSHLFLGMLIFRFDVVYWRPNSAQTLAVTGSDTARTRSDSVTSWMGDQTVSNSLVSQGKDKGSSPHNRA